MPAKRLRWYSWLICAPTTCGPAEPEVQCALSNYPNLGGYVLAPYKVVEDSETSITYQYNSLYGWALIVMLLLLVTGLYFYNIWLQAITVIFFILYFAAKHIVGYQVTKAIRAALASNSVELSGSKYSFSNPLTIKVPKND